MVRLAIIGVRAVTPLLVRVMLTGVRLAVFALVFWAKAAIQTAGIVAHEYQQRSAMSGMDSRLDAIFYRAAWVIVVVELIVGWFVAAHLTVWLAGVIF